MPDKTKASSEQQPDTSGPTQPLQGLERKLDETVPGGRYIVNGRLVNANGEPIQEKQ
jgi:hypothetical protein